MKINHIVKFAAISIGSLHISHAQEAPKVIQTVYEVFALPKAEAAAMQREVLADQEIYKRMISGLDSGKVVQKKLLTMRSINGHKSTVESIVEFIYPTEYAPPELPNSVGISTPSGEKPNPKEELEKVAKGPGWQAGLFPATAATPSAFDTKNLGDTLEAEVAYGDDSLINIRFSSNHISLLGKEVWGQGLSETEMPHFAVQISRSSLLLTSGVPTCAGTISPGPEEQPKEGEAQVWFAFFTVTLIEVKE